MSSVNVDYYEKIKALQERQHRSELRRMELDRSLPSQATSENRLAKLRAVKLQNYWKKICDDQKRSQWRNEQLLKDVERIDKHLAALTSRTDKLKLMKKQYEDYVERMYPNWKEKVVHYQRIKQENERRAEIERAQKLTSSNAGYIDIPDLQKPSYRISHTLPNMQQSPVLGNGIEPNQQSVAVQMSQTSIDHRPTDEVGLTVAELIQPTSARSVPSVGGKVSSDKIEAAPSDPVRIPVAMGQKDDDSVNESKREQDFQETSLKEAESRDEVDTDNEDDARSLLSPRSESPTRNESVKSPRSPRGAYSPARTPDLTLDGDDLVTEEPSVYVEADITLEGLGNLLQYIEEDIPSSHSPENFYRTQTPALSVRKEVIFNANKGAPLSYMDSASVSMVVLDQLPLMMGSCEGGCLLSDDILYKPPNSPSSDLIKSKIHLACHSFWDTLFMHFVHLLKYDIMSATEIGEIFAPLLIADDSPYEPKAVVVLTRLMESIQPDEIIQSPRSTSTFSTFTSPRKREEITQKTTGEQESEGLHKGDRVYVRPPVVPQLSLPRSESEYEDGDKVDIDVTVAKIESPELTLPAAAAVANTTTPLTQTAAYRQLLGDTMSSQKTMSYEDSEASSDDIENQLGLSSPRRKNPISEDASCADITYDDMTETSVAPPASNSKPSWLTDMQKTGSQAAASSAKPNRSTSVISDDDFDPVSTGGYVPSGIDTGKSGKSTASFTLGSSGKQAARKPAFMYGDSDTDEDIDVPAATSGSKATKAEDDKDDFDFYD